MNENETKNFRLSPVGILKKNPEKLTFSKQYNIMKLQHQKDLIKLRIENLQDQINNIQLQQKIILNKLKKELSSKQKEMEQLKTELEHLDELIKIENAYSE